MKTQSDDSQQSNHNLVSAYDRLLEALMVCADGQENKLLQSNKHLLDLTLLERIYQSANRYQQSGEVEISKWLMNLAEPLKRMIAAYLLEQGNQQYKENDFRAADQSWTDALSLYKEDIEDRTQEGNLLNRLGIVRYFMGEYQATVGFCQEAITIYRELDNRVGESEAQINVGNAFYSSGRYSRAIECYRKSLEIKRELGDQKGEATNLMNIGNVLYSVASYEQAIEHYKQALKIQVKIGHLKEEAKSRGNIASVYLAIGQYKNAIDTYEQQLSIAKKLKDRLLEANALNNLGAVHGVLGQHDTDISYQEKSLNIYRDIGYRHGEACVLGNLSSAYGALGNVQLDIQYQHQSLAIAKELGDLQGTAMSLGSLGGSYLSQADYKVAADYYRQYLKISEKINDRRGVSKAFSGLGIIYHALHKYDAAVDYHQKSLALAKEIQDPDSQQTALNNLGYSLFIQGESAQAEAVLQEAIAITEDLRSDLKDAYKISFFEEQLRSYRLLQVVLVSQGLFSKALEISERSRARAFVDLLSQRSVQTATELTGSLHTGDFITSDKIKDLAQSQNLTLVEYSIVNSGQLLLTWVVEPTQEITLFKTALDFPAQGQDSLLEIIEQVRTKLSCSTEPSDKNSNDSSEDSALSGLRQLYHILIEPIHHLLPTEFSSPVVFVPQDELFLVPFATLQDDSGKCLVETYNVATVPSIQVLKIIQTQKGKASRSLQRMLIVGNPKMPVIPLSRPSQKLKDLAWASVEAEIIAKLFNTQAITGEQATKAYVQLQMPETQIIHLATHGLLDDIRQLGIPGAIALAPSDLDSGFLTAGEIYTMKLSADLVVLSACNTGRGKITGDGVVGLSRCLIAAGVKSVIVSLWSIDDLSTALLMLRFYQLFQGNMSAVRALNDSQRWLMSVEKEILTNWVEEHRHFLSATLRINLSRRLHLIKNEERPFQAPIYWAGFCAIGQ